mgnify:CR=1 FL=1
MIISIKVNNLKVNNMTGGSSIVTDNSNEQMLNNNETIMRLGGQIENKLKQMSQILNQQEKLRNKMHDITIGVREGTDAIIGEIHNKYTEYLTKYDQVNKEKEQLEKEKELLEQQNLILMFSQSGRSQRRTRNQSPKYQELSYHEIENTPINIAFGNPTIKRSNSGNRTY